MLCPPTSSVPARVASRPSSRRQHAVPVRPATFRPVPIQAPGPVTTQGRTHQARGPYASPRTRIRAHGCTNVTGNIFARASCASFAHRHIWLPRLAGGTSDDWAGVASQCGIHPPTGSDADGVSRNKTRDPDAVAAIRFRLRVSTRGQTAAAT